MGRKTVYIHRVGTITAGITLVLTGVLFLVRLFFPFFDPYEVIRFWAGTSDHAWYRGASCEQRENLPGDE